MLIVCGLHCLCFKLILWYIAWDIENDIDHHHSVHNMCFIWNVYSYVQWMSWVGHIIFHFHASVMVDTIGCEWNFNQIVVYNQWYKFSMAWYTPQHIIRQWQAFHIFIFQSRYKSHRKSRYRQYHTSLYDACRWNAYSSWSWIFNDKITLCEYIKKKNSHYLNNIERCWFIEECCIHLLTCDKTGEHMFCFSSTIVDDIALWKVEVEDKTHLEYLQMSKHFIPEFIEKFECSLHLDGLCKCALECEIY